MPQPIWVTPAGNFGVYIGGSPLSKTFAANPSTTGSTLTYTKIGGSYPDPSFILNAGTGVLTGTPANVPLETQYTFTLRVTEFVGPTLIGYSDRVFSLLVNPAQPTWTTAAGNIGSYPENVPIAAYNFSATPSGAYTLLYEKINGNFPNNSFTLSTAGVLTGTPGEVGEDTSYPFTIRVTQWNGPINMGFADRTFSITVQGVTPPTFDPIYYPATTYYPIFGVYPLGLNSSTWTEYQVLINNPDPNSTAIVTVFDGSLPPGLEINSSGLIRGYADNSSLNYQFTLKVESVSGFNTQNFSIQILPVPALPATPPPTILNTRPRSFTILPADPNKPYYIDSSGLIGVFSQDNYFIYKILGNSFASGPVSYNITGSLPLGVTDNINYRPDNTTATVVDPGLGYLVGDSVTISGADIGGVTPGNDLYLTVVAVDGSGGITELQVNTSALTNLNVDSENIYSTKGIVGGTGVGATANVAKINAGWILGTITNNPALTVETYNFTYTAINNINGYTSDPISFSMEVVAQIDNIPFDISVVWLTESAIGTINIGSISNLAVVAENVGGLSLEYTLDSGSLPTDLTLNSDGTISGTVAWETESTLTPEGGTVEYTFTVIAQNITYPEITSTKTFTLNVYHKYGTKPYESLYIRSLFDIPDRNIVATLLNDDYLIPEQFTYRPDDPNFGKASDVVYQHMYGVPASTVNEYITAVEKNHYRRNIILGPIKTAIAKDQTGVVQYEVVYSEIVDNLVNNDGVSISKEITWPFAVPVYVKAQISNIVRLGNVVTVTTLDQHNFSDGSEVIIGSVSGGTTPFDGIFTITSTTTYTFIYNQTGANESGVINVDSKAISKEFETTFYPNSLDNMNKQIADELGQDTQASLLPLWMSGQQEDGSILGFTRAWVICYTLPGYSKIIKNNIISPFTEQIPILSTQAANNLLECTSTAGFYPGMRVIFSGTSFGNIVLGFYYYVYTIVSEKQFTISQTFLTGPALNITSGTGSMFMEHLDWEYRLNQLNYRIDRFEVSKSLSFDYNLSTSTWTALPSGVDPTDSHDEYIYFNKNILGNQ